MARKITLALFALSLSFGVSLTTVAPADAKPVERLWCC